MEMESCLVSINMYILVHKDVCTVPLTQQDCCFGNFRSKFINQEPPVKYDESSKHKYIVLINYSSVHDSKSQNKLTKQTCIRECSMA